MQKETYATHQQAFDQLAAIKQNDDAALKALYLENYSKVEAYVVKNHGTADEAKDIYQEAFIAVWRNIQLNKFTPATDSSLSGYLYRVAKNKWLDHLRSGHYKNKVPLEAADKDMAAGDGLADSQHSYLLAVRQNFFRLGQTCREVLQRFYFKKESMRTIALAFDWTEATAKNNKYRCLQQLRELIKKQ